MNAHIKTLQSALGFSGKDVDGKRGPKTNAAILAAADAGLLAVAGAAAARPESKPGAELSAKSEANLKGVNPALVAIVREAATQVPFAVIEGLRTKERQNQLLKQGATKTLNSYHLTGHAVDLWPVDENGKNLPSDAAFKRGSAEAKAADKALWDGLRKIAQVMKLVAADRGVALTWGGDWKTFPDGPHFQIKR